MGRDLAASSTAAQAVFAAVDQALGQPLSALAFDGPADELVRTANVQPLLMAASIAAFRALEERLGSPLAPRFAVMAGHSLGEYGALVAAGSLDLADAARLLRRRGEAMQRAVPEGRGGMAAVLGIGAEAAAALASAAAAPDEPCEVANDNADGQVVLSGSAAAIERAMGLARDHGAKRAVRLQVSAPFHCSLMAPAAAELAPALRDITFATPAPPIVANVTAAVVTDAADWPALLERQVAAPVRWRETMVALAAMGVDRVIEFGPGKVLAGLARRALPAAAVLSVETPADLDAASALLAGTADRG